MQNSVGTESMKRTRRPAERLRHLFRSYGFWGLLRLVGDTIATSSHLPQARLLRRPFYIRGHRWITVGTGFVSGPGLRMDAFPLRPEAGSVLRIGRDVQVNDDVHLAAISSLTIGDRVLIASRVFITDHNHGSYKGNRQDDPRTPPADRLLSYEAVSIGDDVWIGEQVIILPGVRIGEGAVIGALSLVNRDVEPYTIAAGCPARAIKRYNFSSATWDVL